MDNKFGKRINLLRREHGLSIEKLARAIEVNKSTISRYENGLRNPSLPIVIKICNYFNVSLDWLAGNELNKSN